MKPTITKAMREYLASIGARGGSVTSDAKAEAAQKNGARGGRPKGAKDKAQRKKRKD